MHMYEEGERDQSVDITLMFWRKNSNYRPSRGLVKKISLLIVSINEFKSKSTIFNQVTNEVMSDHNVFGLRVLNMIFRDIYGIGNVTVDSKIIFDKYHNQEEVFASKEVRCNNYQQ